MRDGEDGEIVGPVEEIGDAAEAFRLALGAEHALRQIEPFQRGILGGRDFGHHVERELLRHRRDGERLVAQHIFVGPERASVERDGNEFQRLAVEHQGRRRAVARDLHAGADAGGLGIEDELQRDLRHFVIRGAIILQMDGMGFFGTHAESSRDGASV